MDRRKTGPTCIHVQSHSYSLPTNVDTNNAITFASDNRYGLVDTGDSGLLGNATGTKKY
jgi:hypothetical protein